MKKSIEEMRAMFIQELLDADSEKIEFRQTECNQPDQ